MFVFFLFKCHLSSDRLWWKECTSFTRSRYPVSFGTRRAVLRAPTRVSLSGWVVRVGRNWELFAIYLGLTPCRTGYGRTVVFPLFQSFLVRDRV